MLLAERLARRREPPDLRQHGVALVARRARLDVVGRDDDRRAPRRQMMPTSLVALWPPVPVLSPTRQSLGTPARSRLSPVLLATSHAVSCAREGAESASPSTVLRNRSNIARGVVVSRGSPGWASFNAVSRRSSRV